MSGNDRAFATLDGLINALKSVEKEALPAIAKETANGLDKRIRSNIASGVSPDGKPWQPTKKGEKPLRNAGKALRVAADGSRVVASLTGPEALHHMGTAKGAIKRQILPDRANQEMAAEAATEAASKVLKRHFEP